MTTYRVAILAYESCMGSQLFGIADILRIAADVAHASAVQVEFVAVGGGTIYIGGNVQLTLNRPRGRYDLIIVPGMAVTRDIDWPRQLDGLQKEVAFVRRCFARGTKIASVCVGAFLLGEAGILDGRYATTAWLFAKQFAERYPKVIVEQDRLLIEDSGITTSGAVSAVFDLALHLTRNIFGAQAAVGTAHAALLSASRVSQAPFVDRKMLDTPPPGFANSLDQWLRHHLREPFELERAAKAFHVSTRTFLRRVKAETGHTPLALIQRLRIEQAKQFLVGTRWSVGRVTEEVGYLDQASFTRLFTRLVGMTPAQYRQQMRMASRS